MRRTLCGCGLAALTVLVSASNAFAQAAVDQYVPSDNPAGHRGTAAQAVAEATGSGPPPASGAKPSKVKPKKAGSAGALSGPSSSGSDGGGYPLTAFVIIVALLFIAGVAARYLPGLVRRWRPRQLS